MANIKIVKASAKYKKEYDEFDTKEWHGLDLEHYGHSVEWNEKKFSFLAIEDEKIVGNISGKHQSGVIYIDDLIVASDSRGKGVGALLLEKAEEFAKKYKAHKFHLITGKGWKANDFYLKMGFKKIADLSNLNFHRDFVIYEREIV